MLWRQEMRRRRFLNLVALGATVLFARPLRFFERRSQKAQSLRFYIAGVRFYDVDPFALKPGMRVELRRALFNNAPCYAIYDTTRCQLGFVPKQWVSLIESGVIRSAALSKVRAYAVPWNQLEVTIELAHESDRTIAI